MRAASGSHQIAGSRTGRIIAVPRAPGTTTLRHRRRTRLIGIPGFASDRAGSRLAIDGKERCAKEASMVKRLNLGRFCNGFVLFALALTALTAAGCAQQSGSSDEQRRGGFYGGVIGGLSRP